MTVARRPRIALLAAPETSGSVLYGLYDVLQSVGPMWPDMTVGEPGDALLEVSIVAATAEPFRCFGGIPVEPHAAVADVDDVDAVVVCDMYTPIDTPPRGRFAVEIDWLRRMRSRGALLATVCIGLAAAGRGRAARRTVLRGALGVPGSVPVRVPEDPVRARAPSWTCRARRTA